MITNRYNIVVLMDLSGPCNPNGDPDFENRPRHTPDGRAMISSVALKRRMRDFVAAYCGKEIAEKPGTSLENTLSKPMDELLQQYWDIRTFGQVLMQKGKNDSITGPVQVDAAFSIDPVNIEEDVISHAACHHENEEKKEVGKLGKRWRINYAMFMYNVNIDVYHSKKSGFSEDDLSTLIEAIKKGYDTVGRTSSKSMQTIKIYVFKHVGNDPNEEQKARQATIGCASLQKLVGLIKVTKSGDVECPKSGNDYVITFDKDSMPSGVELDPRSMI